MKLGVCYYPEHWPETCWADDAARMHALGLRLVRIGEFAWSRIEPEPGRLQWDWLDRAVDTLAAAGLEIVLGTPTATPPKWLVDQHPEILPLDAEGNPRRFGSRRHYCFASDLYRQQCHRIVELMSRRYGHHPAVVAWQTDNEYGCHDTVLSYSVAAAEGFRRWLAHRYQRIERLNQAWGTVFWSQEYRDFGEIDPPVGAVTEANPAHRLDYRRFASDQVGNFNRVQTAILRSHSPNRDLLHNYMGLFTDFDHFKVAADLDIAGWDSYPLGFLERSWLDDTTKTTYCRTGHPDIAAFHHDLYRGVGRGRLWVMEQQPGPVNWARYNPAPLPGMVRLWTWEAFAHGAEVVSYFRWRQAARAQEQLHAALNLPDGSAAEATQEVARVAAEIEQLPAAEPASADVALIFDYQADWVFQIQPQGADFHYLPLVFEWYCALRAAGLNIDIVAPGSSLNAYQAVFVPSLPMVTESALTALQGFPGPMLIGPRSGSKSIDFSIPQQLPPGPLQSLIPITVQRVESLRPGVAVELTQGNRPFAVHRWREIVNSELIPEASFADGRGALFRHANRRYLAGWPEPSWLASLVGEICRHAAIEPMVLGSGLRLRRRGRLRFAFNFGPESQVPPIAPGSELLLGKARLEAGELCAWREPSQDVAK